MKRHSKKKYNKKNRKQRNFTLKNRIKAGTIIIKYDPNNDYYKLLGLNPDANQDEIQKSYKKLAVKWRPDKNIGNPQAGNMFQNVTEAYAILKDDNDRRTYDDRRNDT